MARLMRSNRPLEEPKKMKPESQNTWTRLPSSRSSRVCSGERSTLLENSCRVRWRLITPMRL